MAIQYYDANTQTWHYTDHSPAQLASMEMGSVLLREVPGEIPNYSTPGTSVDPATMNYGNNIGTILNPSAGTLQAIGTNPMTPTTPIGIGTPVGFSSDIGKGLGDIFGGFFSGIGESIFPMILMFTMLGQGKGEDALLMMMLMSQLSEQSISPGQIAPTPGTLPGENPMTGSGYASFWDWLNKTMLNLGKYGVNNYPISPTNQSPTHEMLEM